LTLAVAIDTLPQSRLDDVATRILATYCKYAPYTNIGYGSPPNVSAPHAFHNSRTPASASTIMQGAMEGRVLVKNVNGALPLQSPQFISLFVYDDHAPPTNNPPNALWSQAFSSTGVPSARSFDIVLNRYPVPPIAINRTLQSGAGSRAATPLYISDPYQTISVAAQKNGAYLAWDFISTLPTVDPASEVCVVFMNAFATEGVDRPSLSDSYSDDLVKHVASQCRNT